MPHTRSRRGLPDSFEFEGSGEVARDWLDRAFGAQLRLAGEFGTYATSVRTTERWPSTISPSVVP